MSDEAREEGECPGVEEVLTERGLHCVLVSQCSPLSDSIVLLLVLQHDGRIAGMLCRREVGVLSGVF